MVKAEFHPNIMLTLNLDHCLAFAFSKPLSKLSLEVIAYVRSPAVKQIFLEGLEHRL